MKEEKYDEALTLANINDIASYKRLKSKISDLKYCYGIIESENIKTIPKINWLVDLGLSLNYFNNL
jgi:hypothetical protein